MESEIIPFVITWDGMVTQFNMIYREKLEIDMNVFSYIQSIVLKKTFEIMVNGNNRFDITKCKRSIEDYLEEIIEESNNKDMNIEEGNIIEINKEIIFEDDWNLNVEEIEPIEVETQDKEGISKNDERTTNNIEKHLKELFQEIIDSNEADNGVGDEASEDDEFYECEEGF